MGQEVLIRASSRVHFPQIESSSYSSCLRSRLVPWSLGGSPWVAAVKVGADVGREVTSEGTAEVSRVKGVPRSREAGEWGGTRVGIGNRTLCLTSSWRGGSLWGPSCLGMTRGYLGHG